MITYSIHHLHKNSRKSEVLELGRLHICKFSRFSFISKILHNTSNPNYLSLGFYTLKDFKHHYFKVNISNFSMYELNYLEPRDIVIIGKMPDENENCVRIIANLTKRKIYQRFLYDDTSTTIYNLWNLFDVLKAT